MPQTTYNLTPPRGIEGQIADLAERRVESLASEEVAAVPFGRGVKIGTAQDQFLLPAALVDKVRGFLIHTYSREDLTAAGLVTGEVASVLRQGTFYALPEANVSKGDPVFVRVTAHAALNEPGRLRADVDNDGVNDTAVAVAGAQWDEDGLANVPTRVIVNLP